MMHNTPEQNEAFRKAFDATNAQWKAAVTYDKAQIDVYVCNTAIYPTKCQAYNPSLKRFELFTIKSVDRYEFKALLGRLGYQSIQFV